ELQSIVPGFRNHATRAETTPERVAERSREKEVLKRRLNTVVTSSAAVAEHLKTTLAALNGQPGDPRSFDALHRLLERYAPYRLAHWRGGGGGADSPPLLCPNTP